MSTVVMFFAILFTGAVAGFVLGTGYTQGRIALGLAYLHVTPSNRIKLRVRKDYPGQRIAVTAMHMPRTHNPLEVIVYIEDDNRQTECEAS